ADYLVPRNDGRFLRRQLTLDHVQVGPANPTCVDADQDLVCSGLGVSDFDKIERAGLDGRDGFQHTGFHSHTGGTGLQPVLAASLRACSNRKLTVLSARMRLAILASSPLF